MSNLAEPSQSGPEIWKAFNRCAHFMQEVKLTFRIVRVTGELRMSSRSSWNSPIVAALTEATSNAGEVTDRFGDCARTGAAAVIINIAAKSGPLGILISPPIYSRSRPPYWYNQARAKLYKLWQFPM